MIPPEAYEAALDRLDRMMGAAQKILNGEPGTALAMANIVLIEGEAARKAIKAIGGAV
jgi:hypothetical protein